MRVLSKQRPQLNKKQVEGIFYISLMMLSLFAFLFLGADGYVLFDDSGSYMQIEKYVEGVMPVYPLLLHFNKIVFGENNYLSIVIIEQAIYAAICITLFVGVVKNKFSLKCGEAYCLFVFSFLPFATDMPNIMATQEILTEGIAYATFYLFMIALLQMIWTRKGIWMIALLSVTFFLSATRSQLQILFGVCGISFLYVILKSKKLSWIKNVIIGIGACAIISLGGIWGTSKISVAYQEMLKEKSMLVDMENRETQGEELQNQNNLQEGATPVIVTSQYVTLIFSKGMYEADYEDYMLFEDKDLQELYKILYKTADENKCRYEYATPGLWMWKDIVGGVGAVGGKCFDVQTDYYKGIPDIFCSNEYGNIRSNNQMKIGLTLLRAHWGRALYHAIMLLPQAFISTIFFQVESIYLLCHLITLFLYLSAIILMIWAFADKKVERAYAEFMAAVLGTNIVMVVIISLAFFGQQRYLVYNFGIFYIVYFLLALKFWKLYGKNWLEKWIKKVKF